MIEFVCMFALKCRANKGLIMKKETQEKGDIKDKKWTGRKTADQLKRADGQERNKETQNLIQGGKGRYVRSI